MLRTLTPEIKTHISIMLFHLENLAQIERSSAQALKLRHPTSTPLFSANPPPFPQITKPQIDPALFSLSRPPIPESFPIGIALSSDKDPTPPEEGYLVSFPFSFFKKT